MRQDSLPIISCRYIKRFPSEIYFNALGLPVNVRVFHFPAMFLEISKYFNFQIIYKLVKSSRFPTRSAHYSATDKSYTISSKSVFLCNHNREDLMWWWRQKDKIELKSIHHSWNKWFSAVAAVGQEEKKWGVSEGCKQNEWSVVFLQSSLFFQLQHTVLTIYKVTLFWNFILVVCKRRQL